MDRLEIEKDSKLLEEEQMKQIVEVYRKKIVRQLEDNARKTKGVSDAKGDVIINEDYTSESFGEIKRVFLEITSADQSDGIKPVVKVDQVRIGDESPLETGSSDLDPKLKKQLENSISTMFSLDSENIVISQSDKH